MATEIARLQNMFIPLQVRCVQDRDQSSLDLSIQTWLLMSLQEKRDDRYEGDPQRMCLSNLKEKMVFPLSAETLKFDISQNVPDFEGPVTLSDLLTRIIDSSDCTELQASCGKCKDLTQTILSLGMCLSVNKEGLAETFSSNQREEVEKLLVTIAKVCLLCAAKRKERVQSPSGGPLSELVDESFDLFSRTPSPLEIKTVLAPIARSPTRSPSTEPPHPNEYTPETSRRKSPAATSSSPLTTRRGFRAIGGDQPLPPAVTRTTQSELNDRLQLAKKVNVRTNLSSLFEEAARESCYSDGSLFAT